MLFSAKCVGSAHTLTRVAVALPCQHRFRQNRYRGLVPWLRTLSPLLTTAGLNPSPPLATIALNLKLKQLRAGLSLYDEAHSIQHMMTHRRKNPHCEHCQLAKLQKARAPNRRKQRGGQEAGPEVKKFGDFITADHIITRGELSLGGDEQKTALIILDKFTKWLAAFPLKDKSTDEAVRAFQHFAGTQKVKKLVSGIYTDASPRAELNLVWSWLSVLPTSVIAQMSVPEPS